jgi:CBS domain-containing protein
MTTKVVTARMNDSIDIVSKRLSQHNISGIPVVDEQNHVVGIVTASDIARLLGRTLK